MRCIASVAKVRQCILVTSRSWLATHWVCDPNEPSEAESILFAVVRDCVLATRPNREVAWHTCSAGHTCSVRGTVLWLGVSRVAGSSLAHLPHAAVFPSAPSAYCQPFGDVPGERGARRM